MNRRPARTTIDSEGKNRFPRNALADFAEPSPNDRRSIAGGGERPANDGRSEIDPRRGSQSRREPLSEGQRVADLRPRLPA